MGSKSPAACARSTWIATRFAWTQRRETLFLPPLRLTTLAPAEVCTTFILYWSESNRCIILYSTYSEPENELTVQHSANTYCNGIVTLSDGYALRPTKCYTTIILLFFDIKFGVLLGRGATRNIIIYTHSHPSAAAHIVSRLRRRVYWLTPRQWQH